MNETKEEVLRSLEFMSLIVFNKYLQVLVLIYVWDTYLGVELPNHMAILRLTFWWTAKVIGFYNDDMSEGFLALNVTHVPQK